MTSYEKLKYLVKKLLKFEEINNNLDELKERGITKDIYKDFITKLNQAKVISSPFKGTNYIKFDLINKNYFFDDEKNASIISSLVHLENKSAKYETINYVFKYIPKHIAFMFNNSFSNHFNEKLMLLLNEDERFSYFVQIIELNSNETKNICRVLLLNKIEEIEIVPLDYFIYESSWYICCYNLDLRKIDVINSSIIIKSKVINELFSNYIDKKDIKNEIIKFVESFHQDLPFLVRLNTETLNQLIELSLIKSFSVYEEREKKFEISENKFYKYVEPRNYDLYLDEYDEKTSFMTKEAYEKMRKKRLERLRIKLFKTQIEKKKTKKRLYKIDFNLINMRPSLILNEEYFFGETKKYFIKIITSQKNFDCISKTFNVEIVDRNLYRI